MIKAKNSSNSKFLNKPYVNLTSIFKKLAILLPIKNEHNNNTAFLLAQSLQTL